MLLWYTPGQTCKGKQSGPTVKSHPNYSGLFKTKSFVYSSWIYLAMFHFIFCTKWSNVLTRSKTQPAKQTKQRKRFCTRKTTLRQQSKLIFNLLRDLSCFRIFLFSWTNRTTFRPLLLKKQSKFCGGIGC